MYLDICSMEIYASTRRWSCRHSDRVYACVCLAFTSTTDKVSLSNLTAKRPKLERYLLVLAIAMAFSDFGGCATVYAKRLLMPNALAVHSGQASCDIIKTLYWVNRYTDWSPRGKYSLRIISGVFADLCGTQTCESVVTGLWVGGWLFYNSICHDCPTVVCRLICNQQTHRL